MRITRPSFPSRRFLLVLLAPFLPISVFATGQSPLISLHDLVAGTGEIGFQNGPFYLAQFDHPGGMVCVPEGDRLYLADRGNNRIRFVDLDRKNEVSTLAGTGLAGSQNGPLLSASFRGPTSLALLPDGRIAVDDFGNGSIRILDLGRGTVTTLVQYRKAGDPPGPYPGQLVYLSSNHALYLSRPGEGPLDRILIPGGEIQEVHLPGNGLSHPSALCAGKDRLFLCDRDLPGVWEWIPGMEKLRKLWTPAMGAGFHRSPACNLTLTRDGKSLYLLQASLKTPLVRIFPQPSSPKILTIWPESSIPLKNPGSWLPSIRELTDQEKWGLVPDPRFEGRLLVSNPILSILTSVQVSEPSGDMTDLKQDALMDRAPAPGKPKGVFRILLVGRSYSLMAGKGSWTKDSSSPQPSPMALLSRRLELELNTRGALEGSSKITEVMDGSKVERHNLYIWSYYEVPPLCEKYDIDLVVMLMDPRTDLYSYFLSPLGPEGIPQFELDPEFNLLPNSKKFKDERVREFFDLCKTEGLIRVGSDGRWSVANFNLLTSNPRVRKGLIGMIGKPLGFLNRKLSGMAIAGRKGPRLLFCFFPTGDIYEKTRLPSSGQRRFWEEMCREEGIEFLDLSDDFAVLRPSYFPFSEGVNNDHFDIHGQALWSSILSFELEKRGFLQSP